MTWINQWIEWHRYLIAISIWPIFTIFTLCSIGWRRCRVIGFWDNAYMDCLQYLWAEAGLGWPILSVRQRILISGRIALKGFLVDTENMESSAVIEPLLAHIGIWWVCGVWGGRFPCLRCCWCCIVYSLTNDAERLASRARFAYQPPKHQSSDHIHEIEVGCWSF